MDTTDKEVIVALLQQPLNLKDWVTILNLAITGWILFYPSQYNSC